MSNSYESGKVTIPSNQVEFVVSLSETYIELPVIKITSNKNINIFISDVTTTSFKINKSNPEEVTVHYIAIER
jgi:hypothetical protein